MTLWASRRFTIFTLLYFAYRFTCSEFRMSSWLLRYGETLYLQQWHLGRALRLLCNSNNESQHVRNMCGTCAEHVRNMWQLVATCGNLWQLVATCGNLWQLVATCGNLWQLVATCGDSYESPKSQTISIAKLICTKFVSIQFYPFHLMIWMVIW